MKALLVGPTRQEGLACLNDLAPTPLIPAFGQSLYQYWIEHLAQMGGREIHMVVQEKQQKILEALGVGEKWGLRLRIFEEPRGLSLSEAVEKYKVGPENEWLPGGIVHANSFPRFDFPALLGSYEAWFRGLLAYLPDFNKSERMGLTQQAKQIWISKRTNIHPSVKVLGACWIGANVKIGPGTIIGPNAIIEDNVVIENGCTIENSWVGPETFIGPLAKVGDSLAWGNTLINWQSNSCIVVPDAFLMCSMAAKPKGLNSARGTALKNALNTGLTRPLNLLSSVRAKLRG